ncbi:MAG: hypothetical protein H0T48_04300 [Gemmatimonadaceae bacterium]|nr:hypothetical protein [Gemmatimonadaceae bacterium]
MTKAKTNALDALRALIAERQQYEQWMSTLESKRDGIQEHVFEKVYGDYRGRLERVIGEIHGHAEELQLSITALSSRLVEVAREEDVRRDSLQEAELRAAVGEYEPAQWEEMRAEAERELEKVAADRESLDSQLGELRSIQKLGAVGVAARVDRSESAPAEPIATSSDTASTVPESPPSAVAVSPSQSDDSVAAPVAAATASNDSGNAVPAAPSADPGRSSLAQIAPAAQSSPTVGQKSKAARTPAGGLSAVKSKEARAEQAKTLKCPECGTPNYPTEWYCERCGAELATM